MQTPLSGGATFVLGSGRSGVACFSTDPAEPGTDWETLGAEDADLRVAAEVVVGRSDVRELTALGMPRVDAAEVSWPELQAVNCGRYHRVPQPQDCQNLSGVACIAA